MKQSNLAESELIKKNLNGDYQFDIKSIFSKSWELTQSSKWLYVQMFAVILLISSITVLVIMQVINIQHLEQITLGQRATTEVLLQLILAPFMVALMITGVKVSAKEDVPLGFLFAYISRSIILCFTTLLLSFISMLGFALYIIPGLYMIIATGFTLMLVADKNMNPFSALGLSVKMVNRYLLPFIILHLIFFLLFILCIFTFGVALIFVGPLYYNAKGLLYKDLFGYGNIAANSLEQDDMESTFNA